MNELLSYLFSPLREGDIALYRGSGNGLAPILLVAAEETSFGCIERLFGGRGRFLCRSPEVRGRQQGKTRNEDPQLAHMSSVPYLNGWVVPT